MSDISYGIDLSVSSVAAGVAYALAFNVSMNQIGLARDYYDLYKTQRNFYYNTFQNTGEAPLTAEVFGVAFYTPDYAGSTPASSLYWYPQFLNTLQAYIPFIISRHNDMFTAPHTTLPSLAVDLAEVNDDWRSYMFRYEEHKRDFLNETRWAQQMDALSYGVKEAANVERGLATSFEGFDKAAGEISGSLNTLGNGLATYTSYNKALDSYWNVVSNPSRSNYAFQ